MSSSIGSGGEEEIEYEVLMHWISPLLKDLPGVQTLVLPPAPDAAAASNATTFLKPLWGLDSSSGSSSRAAASARTSRSSSISGPDEQLMVEAALRRQGQ